MNIMIILNYNDYHTTETYLNQVKEYKTLEKIIVVDNCSTDDSYLILKKKESKKIDVLQTDKNKGYASGNNFGIKYAEKNYKPQNIIISNPDIIVSEDSIKTICDYLDSHDEVAAASGLIHDINENVVSNFAWRLPTYRDILINTFILSSKFYNTVKLNNQYHYDHKLFNKEKILFADVLSGCFFVIKYNVMEDIGFFDERTFLYNEETILGFKLNEKRYKQAVLLNEKVIHLQGVSINKSISNWKFKSKILEESRLVYLENYLKVSKVKIMLFRILFNIGKYEKYLLKNLKQKFMRGIK